MNVSPLILGLVIGVFLMACGESPSTADGDIFLMEDTISSDIGGFEDAIEGSDTQGFVDDGGGDSFGDEDVVESPDPCPDEMVFIPGGVFVMGDEDGNPDAQPPHDVTLSSYCIDRMEVSVAAYQECVVDGICDDLQTFEICLTEDPVRPNSCKPGRENHPVNYISWNRAQNYCEWAGKALPTEAQWERAARGPNGNSYPWGETIGCKFANYEQGFIFDACSPDGVEGDTTPVDSFALGVSDEGVFNLGGNVDEWVLDWHSATTYGQETSVDPQGPEEGEFKVYRGGAFSGPDFTLLTYWRQTGLGVDIASQTSGFRCAATPLESEVGQ